jgi:uncharacterized protein YwqG
MNLVDFELQVASSPLAAHRHRLRELLRPACDILKGNPDPGVGRSRLGGAPDRPRGSKWPQHRLGPHRFLGQINFEELTSTDSGLPANGLLQLFVAYDPDGNFFWGDNGYIHAEYYAPGDVALTPCTPPEAVSFEGHAGVAFRPTLDLPYDEFQHKDWVLNDDLSEAYTALRESLHQSEDYLLGYPSHYSLAYDPTPGPGWVSLITLASDEDLELFWHDDDKLMVFIERTRLAARDFSNLRADAG